MVVNKPIFLTNTKTRTREEFRPLKAGEVSMYSCGPTVYGPIHIGNLRAGLTADLFFRFFKRFGYQVTYVRNYTDIDDKIIKRANEEHVSCDTITQRYTQLVEQDYAMAMMEEPTHKTTVTGYLPQIISMIEQIIKNGKGYATSDGDVYFSIETFPTYGQLSGKSVDDLMAGARVEVNASKKNPMDFALWKASKPGEPSWDSPWGKGRPGWHIECSAMACARLGPRMDLHHGGEDLIFPHHENEIAQSEAANGQAPYVSYWVHNAFLTFSSEKMSKSLGNVVNARDFLSQYGGEVARMVFLGVHYRSIFDFSPETVDNAVTQLERIYEAKKKAEEIAAKKMILPDQRAEAAWGGFIIDVERAKDAILTHYANDLNTPGALSELFSLIREWNKVLATPNAENTPTAIIAAQGLIGVMENEIGSVIGIGRKRAESQLGELSRIRMLRSKNEGKETLSDQEIEAYLQERRDARAAKNFKRGDEIRALLLARGVEIKDSPNGTTWTRK